MWRGLRIVCVFRGYGRGEKAAAGQGTVGVRFKRDVHYVSKAGGVKRREEWRFKLRPSIHDGRCEHIPSDSSHSIEIYAHWGSLSSCKARAPAQ